jgi:hypothetical protein
MRYRLVTVLRDAGHDVHTVPEKGLRSRPDAEERSAIRARAAALPRGGPEVVDRA